MKQIHKVDKELADKAMSLNFPFSGNPYDVEVMEILDEFPDSEFCININFNKGIESSLLTTRKFQQFLSRDTFPNALLEMWIYLKENNLL